MLCPPHMKKEGLALVCLLALFPYAYALEGDDPAECGPAVVLRGHEAHAPLALTAGERCLDHCFDLVAKERARLTDLVVEEIQRRLPTLSAEETLAVTIGGFANMTKMLEAKSSWAIGSRAMQLTLPGAVKERLGKVQSLKVGTGYGDELFPRDAEIGVRMIVVDNENSGQSTFQFWVHLPPKPVSVEWPLLLPEVFFGRPDSR